MNARRWPQIVLGIVWAGLGLSAVVLWWSSDVPLAEVPGLLASWVEGFGLVPAAGLFLALYAVRPLLLFPSTVMGLASGMTFGPVLGSVVTMAGELVGAALAFSLARALGRRWVASRESGALARWDRRLSRHGILTVSVMRLILLPFDTVSYACGLTAIRLREFLAGTFLGGACYILGVTLLGGSAAAGLVGEVTVAGVTVTERMLVLVLSALSFVVGLTIAWLLRHRFTGPDADEPGGDAGPRQP